ncbi:DUF4760 domain-containing protein [Pseudomaricurvus sp. HS19]|uniref:DUF4760 domain-containing protein n=1 Tax=Pseudomaricurvus sp. HS19 TaxID=2692626 RepID=UPI00136E8822|nr:DUF4760 domain-containing protein [Pseudomaricurvus sp. HS19]MYM62420.1 DUF4760 domain-containing protein [Pseudomaricurvus sp. HS19]
MEYFPNIISAIGLMALAIQLHLSRKERRAYHERTKKQATLEHAGPQWVDAKFELETRFGNELIQKAKADEIFKNHELKAHVDRLLSSLEDISAGVNAGIYDGDILYRMCATSFIRSFERFKTYIELRRKEESQEMYIELEAVVTTFTERRRKHPMSAGDILHSNDL